jgi:hypothetical protein
MFWAFFNLWTVPYLLSPPMSTPGSCSADLHVGHREEACEGAGRPHLLTTASRQTCAWGLMSGGGEQLARGEIRPSCSHGRRAVLAAQA